MWICWSFGILSYFLIKTTTLLSLIIEICANFNRLRSISNRFQIMDKISFKYKLSSLIFVSTLFYLSIFFTNQCLNLNNNQNQTESTIISTDLAKTKFFEALYFIHSILRDIICCTILLVLNVLTFISLQKAF